MRSGFQARSRLAVVALASAALSVALLGVPGTASAESRAMARAESRASDALPHFSRARLQADPDALEPLLQSRFPGIFGDVEVTGRSAHVVVLLTRLESGPMEEIRGLAPRGTISFARTHLSGLKLANLQARVTRDDSALARRGIRLVSWFPGIKGDGLEHIGVLHLTSSKENVLDRMFGRHNVVLQDVTTSAIPRPATAVRGVLGIGRASVNAQGGRDSDSSPWSGGDNIMSPDGPGNGCTSGVGITYLGAPYMITASHCFDSSWPVYNGFDGLQPEGPFMGTTGAQDTSNGGADTELISMPVTNRIWTGAIGSPTSSPVLGFGDNPLGATVYNEGAYSGEEPSTVKSDFPIAVESDAPGCITLKVPLFGRNRTECHLVYAVSDTPGGIANQEGDSGGPIVQVGSDGVTVTGIDSASTFGPDTVPCHVNDSACSDNIFYTAMTYVMWNEYPGACIVNTTSCGSNPTPPPPPPGSISIGWGGTPAPSGDWMDITFNNFPVGSVSWYCVEEGTSYGPYTTTLKSSTENLTTNTCYDTEPGGSDYVVSDGVSSNTIATDAPAPPPPPPPGSISIGWGGTPAPSGDWMDITFNNFPVGSVSWYCVEEGTSYGPYTTTLTSSTETLTTNTCYDTESGGSDYVVADGVGSNTIGTDEGEALTLRRGLGHAEVRDSRRVTLEAAVHRLRERIEPGWSRPGAGSASSAHG